ncbi:MAG: ATP synthase F1 subunit gamma [Geobacteraceae bacterium]
MATLKAIKKRITSVKNTGQITKAMKMVSAAKLRRAQEAIMAARPYARKLDEVLQRLAGRDEAESHPLLEKREVKKALLIVISSDRGLCGGFNANLGKAAERFVKNKRAEVADLDVMTLGRKGNEFLRNRVNVVKNYDNILSGINYQTAALIAQEVIERYQAGDYDEVYLIYNAFRSVISQEITLERLLPVSPANPDEDEQAPAYIYEPSKGELLAELLPKNIEVQIFKGLLDSVAAEHAARMTAMDSAAKNASEMIGKLTLQYNRARQAAITKELMEIISGSESIKG